jgi:cobalt-zinc-cadmium efflux system outer membrane protein
MKRLALITSVVVLSVCRAWPLTLDGAVERALKANPNLAATELARASYLAEGRAAAALPDPTIEFGFGSSGSTLDGDMRMVGVSQKIPFPLKLLRLRSRSRTAGLAEESRLASLRREIVSRVKQTYMDLVLIDETLRFYEEDLADVRVFEAAVRRRYEVGKAMQHEVVRAQLEVLMIENAIATTRLGDLPKARARMRMLLNLGPDEHLGDLPRPEIRVADIDLGGVRSLGTAGSPEVTLEARSVELADHDLSLARLDWLPDLRLRFFSEEMDMIMGRNKTRGFMVAANLPIWGWRNKALVDKRRLMLAGARSKLEAKQDVVRLELEQAVAALEAKQASLRLYEDAITPEARLAYISTKAAYETGKTDLSVLITAQRALRDARLSHLRLWAGLAKDLAEIERITGQHYF